MPIVVWEIVRSPCRKSLAPRLQFIGNLFRQPLGSLCGSMLIVVAKSCGYYADTRLRDRWGNMSIGFEIRWESMRIVVREIVRNLCRWSLGTDWGRCRGLLRTHWGSMPEIADSLCRYFLEIIGDR